ncbi:MAG: murein biosynthesis integral membrane protein MurJ [Acetivibrionales bacterium]|nr:oligosaccharide flippase family protein [Clostridiaceae bacterium]
MGRLTHKFESTTKSVFFSTLFSLFARLLSFVQAIIVSNYFGATKSTDFLFFCISITILLPGLFSNINQAVIIPNAIKIREKESNDESKSFIFNIYGFYILIGILVCVLVGAIPEQFMSIASKFTPEDIHDNRLIIILTIPTFFFILTTSFILNVFESYKYFTFPMILDMMKSVLTIVIIVFMGDKYGVVSMAAGILAAHVIQFIILNYLLFRLLGFSFKRKRYKIDKGLKKNILFVVISQVTNIMSQYVGMYLISGLQEGVYTALSYSERIYNILVLVLAGQVTTVLGINIIEKYSKAEYEELNVSYLKYIKVILTIVMPLTFIMSFQATTIISILFERGNFTRESVIMTSIFFRYIILSVPLLVLDRLIVRLIIAKQILHISFVWNIVSKVLSAVAVFVIINYMDFRYYGLGVLLVQLVYIIAINLFMIKKQFAFIQVGKSLRYIGVNTLSCFAVCFVISMLFPMEKVQGVLQKLVTLSLYSAVVVGIYLLIGFVTFNRETISQLISYIGQLIPKFTRRRIEHVNKPL